MGVIAPQMPKLFQLTRSLGFPRMFFGTCELSQTSFCDHIYADIYVQIISLPHGQPTISHSKYLALRFRTNCPELCVYQTYR